MLAVLTVALALQQSVADTSPFRPLALPAATTTRSASGAPGPRYWQQRADYTLQATLDTATSVLRGSGRIYTSIARPRRWTSSGCSSIRISSRRAPSRRS